MTASIIDSSASMDTLLEENTYTLVRLQANSLTVGLAPDFVAFQSHWMTVNAMEIQLTVNLTAAYARVSACDDDIDTLVDAISRAVLNVTKGNRNDGLYLLY